MLRTDEEALLGGSLSDWLRPVSSVSSPKDALEKIYAQHNSLVSEFKCRRADGTSFPVEVAMSQVNVTDAPLCTCIIRDITDRKEVERRVSEFYSMVSHELRTPLTSIRGALGLMEGGLAGELSTKASQLVKVARAESERLIRLINDILDIRRLEAGKLELKLAGVEAGKLVKSTAEAIAGMASEAGIEIDTQIIDGLTIVCDRDRISQVLTNLIANAIKFSETGSHVSIRLEKKAGNWLRFSVVDEGPGIAEDQMHKLFGKFQQLNSTDGRPKGGSGLGLAITKAIIEEHGGKIGVDTEVGHGSTFWFELAIKSEESVPSLKS
jgi:signal transduction histidine kinase